MDIFSEWYRELKSCLKKITQHQFSLKYQNKRLSETGDVVLKLIKQVKDPDAVFERDCLISESRKWNLVIRDCQLTCNSVHLFLDREVVYRYFIRQNIENKVAPIGTGKQICLTCDIDENDMNLCMTDFRIKCIYKAVKNILIFNGYNIIEKSNADELVQQVVIGKNHPMKTAGVINIICGNVITNDMSAIEYMRKRGNDMQLIAQHKYGVRVKDQQRFQITIASLGRSATIVDILESKATSQIDMKKEKNKSTKGAAFILYNYARLSVLFKTFAEKQHINYYPPLPPFNEVDFRLLKEEDEWQLFWVYVARFPLMMQQAAGDGQLNRIASHVMLGFVSGLVISLSKYYRRIRILTENREHLLPVMFARIYLLKSVYSVLSTLMVLLDLEPITEM